MLKMPILYRGIIKTCNKNQIETTVMGESQTGAIEHNQIQSSINKSYCYAK
jgi:hypothetical protein